jgi:hypothetical protein
MDPSLAPKLVAEVLDGVGHVGGLGVDAGALQPLVENPPGRADEGVPGHILAVSGLLAHQHDRRPPGAFAHHGLGGTLIQITGPALMDGRAQAGQGCSRRDRSGRVISHVGAALPVA